MKREFCYTPEEARTLYAHLENPETAASVENVPSIETAKEFVSEHWKTAVSAIAVIAVLTAVALFHKSPEPEPAKAKSELETLTELVNANNVKLSQPSGLPLIMSCSEQKRVETENAGYWKRIQEMKK